MRKSLPTDGRIVRMMSALNADRLRTLGGLMSAWCLLDEHTETGKLDGYTPSAFDEIIGFPGLAAAMQAVGWLEIGDGYLQAPDFERHNGATAKRRAQESVRKMSARNADKCPQEKRTKSAPEKRREEKRISDTQTNAKARASTPEELEEFAISIGCQPAQGTAAFWRWQGNGWMNDGKPIKDWKATVRAWKALKFGPFKDEATQQPRPVQTSFALQDKERKEAERHGPEVIPIKFAYQHKPQS